MKTLKKEFVLKLIVVSILGLIIFNLTMAISLGASILRAFAPLFYGIVIALVINLPMSFFRNKIFNKDKYKKIAKPLSLWISVFILVGVLILIGLIVIPQVIESIKSLIELLKTEDALKNLAETNAITNWLYANFSSFATTLSEKLSTFLPGIVEFFSNTFTIFLNLFLGIFFALLLLSCSEKLASESEKFLKLCKVNDKVLAYLKYVGNVLKVKFGMYLGGQIIEAVIFGSVCYIGMLIFRLPYPALVSVIMGFVNLIPMLGAYIGTAICSVIILTFNPTATLTFIIFITILQQIESVTTYPIIVGKNVGINGFWILASVTIGGSLFGMWGVLIGVPITASIREILSAFYRSNSKKSTELNIS